MKTRHLIAELGYLGAGFTCLLVGAIGIPNGMPWVGSVGFLTAAVIGIGAFVTLDWLDQREKD